MFKNKYPGKCASCTRHIDAGEGFAFKRRGWETVCKSAACHRHLGLTNATPKRLRADGTLSFPYDEEALPLLRSIPGSEFDRETKEWRVSLKDEDLARVIEVAQKLGAVIDLEILERHAKGSGLGRAAEIRAKGLYPFQIEGTKKTAERKKSLLADEMGLGKTVQVLMSMPWDDKGLVFCPASLKLNWREEGKRWRPDYRYTVLNGRDSFRAPERGEIVITNYEILPDVLLKNGKSASVVGEPDGMEEIGKTRKRLPEPADVSEIPEKLVEELRDVILICDEAHVLKSHKAKRSAKVKALSRFMKKVVLVTGTPLMNRPLDLWGVLSAGDMALEVFGSWKRFLKLFRAVPKTWGGYDFGVPAPEVAELLRRLMTRRSRKEVLPDLPNKTYQEIAVDGTTGEVGKRLDELMKLLIERGSVTRSNVVNGELVGGLPDFEEFSEVRAALSESRIPAMLEMVEAAEEQQIPLVVFSDHRAPVLALKDRDNWGIILGDTSIQERKNLVDKFQRGELRGIACTIAAGGVGITLTRASVVLFVDLNWTPALNMQAEDRCCRIGQTSDSVLIQRLYTDHPLDRHIHNLLIKKQRLIAAAIDASATYAPKVEDNGGKMLEPESDEQLQARLVALQSAQAAVARDEARDYVKSHLVSSRQQAGLRRPEAILTHDVKSALKEALSYMLLRCDGAVEDDNLGFSKVHAALMHHVGATGLEPDDDVTFRVLERILSVYSGTRENPGGQLGLSRCLAIWSAS